MMSKSDPNHFSLERDADGAVHLRWNSPPAEGPPTANRLDRSSLIALERTLDQLLTGPRPALVILGSGNNRGFGIGFSTDYLATSETESLLLDAESLRRCCQKLTLIPCPIIAAISGTCFDEAMELAAFCDYRIVFDSPKTRLGFRSQDRQWYPLPEAFPRICSLLGLERGFKLAGSGLTMDAKTALRWGLADTAPATEQELRNAIGLFKGKAISMGKLSHPQPRNWIRRFLQANPMGRKWVAKGLGRWLDRNPQQMAPWAGYLLNALKECAARTPNPESHLPSMWKAAAIHPISRQSRIFSQAVARWSDSKAFPKEKVIRGAASDSPNILIHPLLELLHSKAIPLQTTASQSLPPGKHVQPHLTGMDTALSDLNIEGLATWKSGLPKPDATPGTHQEPGPVRLIWGQAPNGFEEALLWGPFQASHLFYAALENPFKDCPNLRALLGSLGIRTTVHSNAHSSWVSLLFTLIETSLSVLAQKLEPGPFEQEARRKGWPWGPCCAMESIGISFLANTIQTWENSNKDHASLVFSRRFSTWVQTLDIHPGQKLEIKRRAFWVRSNKSGKFQSAPPGRKWAGIAQAAPDLPLNALPDKQRHMEGVDRVERALVKEWQRLPSSTQTESAFLFFHGLLGFPGWKIVSLLPEMADFLGNRTGN